MLDFLLVLGQIPGTDFQLTFNQIVLTLLITSSLYIRIKKPGTYKKVAIKVYLTYLKTKYLYFRSPIIYP